MTATTTTMTPDGRRPMTDLEPDPLLAAAQSAFATLVERGASYLRAPSDTVYRAFELDVLRVEDGAIAEITTFGADRFPAFGRAEPP
jgi:ketosteroid isomerase-like protein